MVNPMPYLTHNKYVTEQLDKHDYHSLKAR